jgi:hypothetical protein
MKDMLARFCHAENIILNVPWSRGVYTYATNGHILVRAPRLEDVPEKEDAPEVDKMFSIPLPDEWFPLADMALPALEATEKTCPECNGAGTKECECPECDGRGMVDFTNRHNDYEVDCKTCNGEGKIHKCDKCNATGKIAVETLQPIKVGASHFQLRYLLLLKDLPNGKIAPAAPSQSLLAAYFAFDGGDGLLMPMKV